MLDGKKRFNSFLVFAEDAGADCSICVICIEKRRFWSFLPSRNFLIDEKEHASDSFPLIVVLVCFQERVCCTGHFGSKCLRCPGTLHVCSGNGNVGGVA